MSDVTTRAKWLFWTFALAVFLLSAIPSLFLIEKLEDYYRLLTGFNPGILKPSSVSRIPHSPFKAEPPDIRFAEFSLKAPRAKSVRLAGSFNQWKAETIPLRREGKQWRILVPLPPGKYYYAFDVDGAWTLDPKTTEQAVAAGRPASVKYVP